MPRAKDRPFIEAAEETVAAAAGAFDAADDFDDPSFEIRLHESASWPAPAKPRRQRHPFLAPDPVSPPRTSTIEAAPIGGKIHSVINTMALSTVDMQLASKKVANLAIALSAGESNALRLRNNDLSLRCAELVEQNQRLSAEADVSRELRLRNQGIESEKRRLEGEKAALQAALECARSDSSFRRTLTPRP